MCDGLKLAMDGAVGAVCLTSHNIDVGAEYVRWTSLQAVFGETGSPRLLGHLLDVHDQFCTACTDKPRMAKAEADAAIIQPIRKESVSDTRDVGITDIWHATHLGVPSSVSTGGECSNDKPGTKYLKATQKTNEYPCLTEDTEDTYTYKTSVNLSSDVSNIRRKYIANAFIVPTKASTHTGYKTVNTNSDDTLICKPSNNENLRAQWMIETENGRMYIRQTLNNSETDTSNTEIFGTEKEDIHAQPVACDDLLQTYSGSIISEGDSMIVNVGKKTTFLSLDPDNANTYTDLVDTPEAIDNTDGCTSKPTRSEAVHISETVQYENGNTLLNNTSCLSSQTIYNTEARSCRSMLHQVSDVYTHNDNDTTDANLTARHGETDQYETKVDDTEQQVTTREDYEVRGHHGLEMECETPDMEQDSEDDGQCYSEQTASECLLSDHTYGVVSRPTSDGAGQSLDLRTKYLQATQKTTAYPCQTEGNEETDTYVTSVNVSSDASNIRHSKYIDNSHMVPTKESTYTGVRHAVEGYTMAITNSDDTRSRICTPTDSENDSEWAVETENGCMYIRQTLNNKERDMSDTEIFGTEKEDIPAQAVVCDDLIQTYSCPTISEEAVSMSVNVGKKATYLSLDSDTVNTYKDLVDTAEAIDNTDGCTRTPTRAESVHISETRQYENGSTLLNNTSCLSSPTIYNTEARSYRSMLNQGAYVNNETSYAKLTTEYLETDQYETNNDETEQQGTTREVYDAIGEHRLKTGRETPEMKQDCEDDGQCYNEQTTSECLPSDHTYGVVSRSTSDRAGQPLQCHHCGIVLSNYTQHIAHLRTHFAQNYFHCDKCCTSLANPTYPNSCKDRDDRGILWCKRCGKALVNGPPKLTCRRCWTVYMSDSRYPGHTCPRKKPATKRTSTAAKKKKHVTKYTCPERNETFSKRVPFKRHLRIHSARDKDTITEYTCQECNKTYSTHARLKDHLRIHLKDFLRIHSARDMDAITQYKCQECKKTYSTPARLKAHTKSIHSTDNHCKCDICGKVFNGRSNLRGHRLTHSVRPDHACAVCHKIFKGKLNLKKHMQFHEFKKFLCSECGKRFSTQPLLDRHTVSHTGVKAHQCDTCGATFSRMDGLKHHVLIIHDGVKNFTCEFCHRAFAAKASMISHTRTHTGERPFVCTTCGKKCRTQTALGSHTRIHTRTHTRDKPFVCTTCGKKFGAKHSLIYHTRTHTGERPFPCTTCGKKFSQKHVLVTHSKTHSRERSPACDNVVHGESLQGKKQFTCSHCSKTFATKQHLVSHKRQHMRPYPCTLCPRSFDTEAALHTHTRRHTCSRDRPFVCTFCGNTFRTKAALTIHYGRIHK